MKIQRKSVKFSAPPRLCAEQFAAVAFGLVLLVGAPGLSQAQTVPVELEGTLEAVDAGAETMTVMSIVVEVPFSTPTPITISSPTASGLTLSDLLLDSLPGRTEPGFLGGTAIILGNSTGGVATATDVVVEPAENVVLGEITANYLSEPEKDGCIVAGVFVPPYEGAIELQGVGISFLKDDRIPFVGAINASGFAINPCTVDLGDLTSVEGYYSSDDGYLHIFLMESDGGDIILDPGDPGGTDELVSIARATCRNSKNRIEVRGSSTDPIGSVTLTWEINQIDPPTEPLTPNADTLEGTYRFRVNVSGECPSTVTVTHDDNGAYVTADVSIR